jgi:hypothetical protein
VAWHTLQRFLTAPHDRRKQTFCASRSTRRGRSRRAAGKQVRLSGSPTDQQNNVYQLEIRKDGQRPPRLQARRGDRNHSCQAAW